MNLLTDIGNTQALKPVIASVLVNQPLKVEFIKLDDGRLSNSKRPRLPQLEYAENQYMFSSNSSAKFLFVKGGIDDSNIEVDKWIEYESCQIMPLVYKVVIQKLSQGKLNDDSYSALKSALDILEKTLGSSKYILKNDVTLADVCIWSTLATAMLDNIVPELNSDFPAIKNWFCSLKNEPPFAKAVKDIMVGDSITSLIKACVLSVAPPALPTVSTYRQPPAADKQKPPAAAKQTSVTSSTDSEPAARVPVTPDELAAAVKALSLSADDVTKPKVHPKPIVPVAGERNVLITSALPYVNNVPHLGNIIGCVLSADVYARFCRLRNYNTLYICGTDEYGTATETKAMEEGLTPQQICDKYNKLHTDIYQWFNIGFDHFGRTTTKHQTEIAQDIFWKLHKNGHIIKDSIEQLLCEKCDRYLADRFVEGVCPFCAYDDARGDQCDKCGKLINAVELKEPRCKMCSSKPVVKTSSHLFMDLPGIEPLLTGHLNAEFEKGIWTHNTRVITKSWIRDGLKPRCISRDLKWGTPVPLEGYTDKVFYVWYDAPIGYISITAAYMAEWQRWWKNPEQVQLTQFMAKDNVPFHSVIFPSELLGTGETWTVVNHLSATEYLNYEDGKFSKSRGVGVFGNNAQDTGIPSDIWRFYLLYIRPESQDSSFSWEDFMTKNNSELLNNLGNFINRALMFVANFFQGVVPPLHVTDDDRELVALVNRELQKYLENLEAIKLRDGIRNILSISRLGNQFMQVNQPWVKVKGGDKDRERAGTVVGLAANLACLLSVLVQPYMPAVSATIQQQLNAPAHCNVLADATFVCYLTAGHKIGTPIPLFQKIDKATVEALQKKFAGQGTPKPAAVAVSPAEVKRLTDEVAKQGDVVRALKAAKAEKAAVEAEVAKLLQLKQQLAAASGEQQKPAAGGGKKQKKGGKQEKSAPDQKQTASKTPAAAAPAASDDVIERLTKDVANQGELVRSLKTNKAEKAQIDQEVAKLLSLKKDLALAQGLNPDEAVGGSKKKKGKK